MAHFHEGMTQMGMHKGRADKKASKGGDKMFGKSNGGSEGVHTNLIASPMNTKFVPKIASAAKGMTHNQGGKKGY